MEEPELANPVRLVDGGEERWRELRVVDGVAVPGPNAAGRVAGSAAAGPEPYRSGRSFSRVARIHGCMQLSVLCCINKGVEGCTSHHILRSSK